MDFCFNFGWIASGKPKNTMQSVSGMPVCEDYLNPRVKWPAETPKTGLDIALWGESVENITCSGKE